MKKTHTRVDDRPNSTDSPTAAQNELEATYEHDQCHDLVCNGSRVHPRGARGHGCSCKGRDTAYVELTELRQTHADLLALVRAIAADASAYPWHIAANAVIAKAEGR